MVEPDDFADQDDVIAGLDDVVTPAIEPGRDIGKNGTAGGPATPCGLCKFISAFGREEARDIRLRLRQNVHREVARGGKNRTARRRKAVATPIVKQCCQSKAYDQMNLGVFVGDACKSGTKKCWAHFRSFALSGLRRRGTGLRVAETGVVAGKSLTLSVKLIAANPERDIKNAAVEILGARLVEQ